MTSMKPGKLQRILGIDGKLFEAGIKQLEKSTGHSAVDVRLIADITMSAHRVMRKLGLDTNDTTGHELYSSLIALVGKNEADDVLADTDYTIIEVEGKAVSLNLMDVVENWHHQLDFSHQSLVHGRRSLRGELLGRYMDHAKTDENTTRQIAKTIGLLD